jgi:hypothetical protein
MPASSAGGASQSRNGPSATAGTKEGQHKADLDREQKLTRTASPHRATPMRAKATTSTNSGNASDATERHEIFGHVGRKEPLQPEKPGSVDKRAIRAKQRWQIESSHI